MVNGEAGRLSLFRVICPCQPWFPVVAVCPVNDRDG
jgi:hypothetical protein